VSSVFDCGSWRGQVSLLSRTSHESEVLRTKAWFRVYKVARVRYVYAINRWLLQKRHYSTWFPLLPGWHAIHGDVGDAGVVGVR
jgi:hypothetical protein